MPTGKSLYKTDLSFHHHGDPDAGIVLDQDTPCGLYKPVGLDYFFVLVVEDTTEMNLRGSRKKVGVVMIAPRVDDPFSLEEPGVHVCSLNAFPGRFKRASIYSSLTATFTNKE